MRPARDKELRPFPVRSYDRVFPHCAVCDPFDRLFAFSKQKPFQLLAFSKRLIAPGHILSFPAYMPI
jgi:hypothetical protein